MKEGETECECGHFYDDNLHGQTKKKQNNKRLNLLQVITIIVIISIMVLVAYEKLGGFKNKPKIDTRCEVLCEGSSYKVNNNKCICSNGEEYSVK